MAMGPCTKCLEKNWAYEMPDHLTVRATCRHCAYEVEFPSRKQKKAHGKHHRPARTPVTHIGPMEAKFDPTAIGDGVAPWI